MSERVRENVSEREKVREKVSENERDDRCERLRLRREKLNSGWCPLHSYMAVKCYDHLTIMIIHKTLHNLQLLDVNCPTHSRSLSSSLAGHLGNPRPRLVPVALTEKERKDCCFFNAFSQEVL